MEEEEKEEEEEEEEMIGVEEWSVLARIMLVLSCCLICSLSTIQIRLPTQAV